MKKIVIYTTNICPYCTRAKQLLNHKELTYTEINVEDEHNRNLMTKMSNGMSTVPQIFIQNIHIGGFDDLYRLNKTGELDRILLI